MRRLCVLLIAASCVACGGSKGPRPAPAALSATWNAPAMLAHVPADTPYMVGVIEPVPQAFRDQLFATADNKLAEALRALEAVPADFDRSGLDPIYRAMFAVLDELRGKDLRRWGAELGFHSSGRFVLYGLSVWPVLRIALADPVKMRRIVRRVIAAAGVTVDEGVLEGRAYWRLTFDGVAVVAAVLDDEAVLAVLPASVVQQALPLVLGRDKPARSLRDTNTVPTLVGHYGLVPAMVGYLDLRAASKIITRRTPSTYPALDRPLRAATGPVSRECRDDLERLVALVPRVIMGYRKLDKRGMHARLVVELPPAITAAIEKLSVAVPGMSPGMHGRPLGAFGVAAKLAEAIPLLRRLAQHVSARPFTCSWFAPLGELTASLDELLARPLPPAVQGLRGLLVEVEDLQREPFSASGNVLIVGDRAHEVVMLVLHDILGMRSVHVAPGGQPVRVPIAMLGMPPAITAHAGAAGGRAAVAVGASSLTRTAQLLKLQAPVRSPLATLAMDSVRLRELGLLDDDDDGMDMRHIVLQLEVIADGLAVEMFGTFPGS